MAIIKASNSLLVCIYLDVSIKQNKSHTGTTLCSTGNNRSLGQLSVSSLDRITCKDTDICITVVMLQSTYFKEQLTFRKHCIIRKL